MERQSDTKFGTNGHREAGLSSAAMVDRARDIANIVEQKEIARGYSLPVARERIASRVGCAPGTLWSLARRRLKRIEEGFTLRLHADNVRGLQLDLARAIHELEMAHQSGLHPASTEMAKLATTVAAAQELLREAGQ